MALELSRSQTNCLWQLILKNTSKCGMLMTVHLLANCMRTHIRLFSPASKTFVIVKPEHEEKARMVFDGCDITTSINGKRHMGVAIGSEVFKTEYISKNVEKWMKDVEELASIARDEPQGIFVFHKGNCTLMDISAEDSFRYQSIVCSSGRCNTPKVDSGIAWSSSV